MVWNNLPPVIIQLESLAFLPNVIRRQTLLFTQFILNSSHSVGCPGGLNVVA